MVLSGLCFVLLAHLEPIGLIRNCVASQKLIVLNVLLSRIDVHFSSIAHFQRYRCGLSMASADVNGSLLMNVDERAFAMMINAFVAIIT